MLNEPFVDVTSGPRFVDRSGGFKVGASDTVEERSTAVWSRISDDIVLFEPSSKLIIVPGREDVVFGVVELLGDFCRGIRGLSRCDAVGRRDG